MTRQKHLTYEVNLKQKKKIIIVKAYTDIWKKKTHFPNLF